MFKIRTDHTCWLWAQFPAAMNDAADRCRGLPANHEVSASVAHAALLLIERETILASGGFND